MDANSYISTPEHAIRVYMCPVPSYLFLAFFLPMIERLHRPASLLLVVVRGCEDREEKKKPPRSFRMQNLTGIITPSLGVEKSNKRFGTSDTREREKEKKCERNHNSD